MNLNFTGKARQHISARRGIIAAVGMALCATAFAQAPDGYYDSLEGKKRTELMSAIAKLADGHKQISYGSDTWTAFKRTDVHFVDGRQAWWDMYSDNVVYTADGHEGLNIEHSLPNSWWGKVKNAAYCDIANLNPSDAQANQRKSNHPLGEISHVTWTNGVSSVGTPVSGQGGGATYVFEPADEYKGDFAREYMYMFVTYQNELTWNPDYDWMYDTKLMTLVRPWASELLIRWSDNDPVDKKEENRNNALYKVQGNRNPFIDLPELADYIWGDKTGESFHAGSAVEVVETADEVEAIYDINGVKCDGSKPGLYIVRYKSGKSVKAVINL